ncbi:histidine phosphatase family protein [Hazenella coriacea]|nr:histidine phosphatase family protein [Hazenella coriacea]
MKHIYLIRHAQAEGQAADAPLKFTGKQQAEKLARYFQDIQVDKIISSPYVRAIETIRSMATQKKIPIELDERLVERKLCEEDRSDWYERLKDSFENLDLTLPGGESSRVAMRRVGEVFQELVDHSCQTTILVSHGNLLTLLLKNIDSSYGFIHWKEMTNPDVFLLMVEDGRTTVNRVWQP